MTSFVAPYNLATVCPDSRSVGKDYELDRRTKRVFACTVVRLLLLKLAARRQVRFRAILYPRKKIPCIVKVNATLAIKHVPSMGSELFVVYYIIQKIQSTREVYLKLALRITLDRGNSGAVLSGA
jgi:hypothetical protein